MYLAFRSCHLIFRLKVSDTKEIDFFASFNLTLTLTAFFSKLQFQSLRARF